MTSHLRHPLYFLLCFLFIQPSLLQAQQKDLASQDNCGFEEAIRKHAAENPGYLEELARYQNEIIPEVLRNARQSSNRGNGPNTLHVPVVVHIIHNGEPIGSGQNLSVQRIQEQIETLNEDFSATNNDFDDTPARWADRVGNPDIQFCLANIDPNGNATNGITRHQLTVTGSSSNNNNIESFIKPMTYWNTRMYYNVWVLAIPGTSNGGGVAGYAYLPSNGIIGQPKDGTVCDWRSFRGGSMVLTHESGHYLGLYHTFNGYSCSQDDGFDDTPNQRNTTSASSSGLNCNGGSYPTGPTTCSEEHMYINYMDYTPSSCVTSFSNQQIAMMRAVLNGEMNHLGWGSRNELMQNIIARCPFFENDVAMAGINAPHIVDCLTDPIVTPQATFTNFGFNPLTSVNINYTINGGPPVATPWTGLLQSGESHTMNLTPFNTPLQAGLYTIKVYPSQPNGLFDEEPANDTLTFTLRVECPTWNNDAGMLNVIVPDQAVCEEYASVVPQVEIINYGIDPLTSLTVSYQIDNGSVIQASWTGSLNNKQTDIFNLPPFTPPAGGASYTFTVFSTNPNGVADEEPANDTLIVSFASISSQAWSTIYEPFETAAFDPTPSGLYVVNEDGDLFQWKRMEWPTANAYGLGSAWFDNYLFSYQSGTRLNKVDMLLTETYDLSNISQLQLNFDLAYAPYADQNSSRHDSLLVMVSTDCGVSFQPTSYARGGSSLATAPATSEPFSPGSLDWRTESVDLSAYAGIAHIVIGFANKSGLGNRLYLDNINLSSLTLDASVTAVLAPLELECAGPAGISPQVRITNNGTQTITSATITYRVDAGAPTVFNWTGTLAPGSSTNVTLPNFPRPAGGFHSFEATVSNPNGGTDELADNDSKTILFKTVDVLTFNSLLEDFESPNMNPTGGGMTVVNPDEDNFEWRHFGTSAYNQGIGSVYFDNYLDREQTGDRKGKIDYLTSPNYDFSNVTGAQVTFDVAYAPGTNNAFDTLQILVSTDCGITYDQLVWMKGGPTLATAAATNVVFNPSGNTSNWRNELVDLSAFDGLPNVRIAFANISGLGNLMYLDNINITSDNSCFFETSMAFTNESCFQSCDGTATVTTSGGTAPFTFEWDAAAGSQTTATASGLCNGIYDVTIMDANGCRRVTAVSITSYPQIFLSTSSTPASCGANDGTATVVASGGIAPFGYQYSWGLFPPQFNSTAINLAANTYTVTVIDGFGCTETADIVVETDGGISLTMGATDVSCNGGSDGTATVTLGGGADPNDFTITWDDPASQSGPVATNLAAAIYTVSVTDGGGCTSQSSVEVSEPTGISLSASGTSLDCPGDTDATATVTASGGTVVGDYTYLWDDPATQNTATATNLGEGIYTVEVTDDNGCTSSTTVSISAPAQINLVTTTNSASCSGQADGSATVIPTGGNGGFSFFWNDPATQNTATASGLLPGTYDVTVTDSGGCTATTSATVDDAVSMDASTTSTDALCNGEATGTASVTASGGTVAGDYTYLWDDPATQNTATATNLAVGVYSVIVTDDNGCTVSRTVQIDEPEIISLSTQTTDVLCNGNANGSASVSATGGTAANSYSYLWNDPAAQNTATATNLTAGTYTITVTDDNACTAVETVLVDEPDALETIIISQENVDCNGDNTGSATIGVSGGTLPYAYTWSNSASGPFLPDLPAGTISGTITDGNGCTTEISITITEPAALLPNLSSTDESSVGANDGSATLAPTGGTSPYTYQWSNSMSTPSIDNLAPGNYSYTITDDNQCTVEGVVTINGFSCAGFSVIVTGTNIDCFGDATGTATADVTGGEGPFTYNWSNTQNTPTATNLLAGTHSVTIIDNNGCEITGEVTITEPGSPIELIASGTDESFIGANDGTATATASGGTGTITYQWSNSMATPSINNLAPGPYTVTVTDENGCTEEATVVIGAGVDCSAFTLSPDSADISCFGETDGMAWVDPSGVAGPYTIQWSTSSSNDTIYNLGPGAYQVTVTADNGCSLTSEITIDEPLALELLVSKTDESAAGANDGSATASASGGTGTLSFLWSNSMNTETISNLAPGTYSVTVTDENGCTAVDEIEILAGNVDCSSLTASISTQTAVSCFGGNDGSATVTATGGNGELSYQWSNSQNTAIATNLPAGPFSVSITDELGCELVLNGEILQPAELTSIINATNESVAGANDGSLSANVFGGTPPYTYAWSNTGNTQTINNLPPGPYTVTITDDNGCTLVSEGEVLPGQVDCSTLSATIQGTDVNCFEGTDGSATVTASGGNGELSYAWNDSQDTPTATNLIAGIYTVTITDELGCELVLEVTIGQPDELTSSTSATPESSLGANDGSATATGMGGTPPYTYAWSNTENTQTINNLPPGIYIVTITDDNGCSIVDEVEVLPGNVDCSTLSATIQGTDVSCFEGTDGSATVTASGGNGELSYAWNDSQDTPTATNLIAGIYTVTITDELGCELVLEVTIGQPDELTSSTSATPESSLGANDGSATATGMGGTPPYTYAWSNTENTQTINNLPPGIYIVTITDDNGCSIVDEVEVLPGNVDCSTLSATIQGTDVSCFEGTDGSATVTASGGNGELSYAWNDSQDTPTATNLIAGIYTVTITDELGCELVLEVTIGQPDELTSSTSATPESSLGANDGSATATGMGGTPPYTYAWSNTENTQTINNLPPGIYIVTITDDNGCSIVDEVEVLPGNVDCSTLSATIQGMDVNCFEGTDGSATVTASGGNGELSYAWNDSQDTPTATNLIAGIYTVTITDELGCELVLEVTIGQPDELTSSTSATPESSLGANDGSATATGMGGTPPYTYAWSNTENTQTINNLPPGIYIVTITDDNGCSIVDEVEVLPGNVDCSTLSATIQGMDVNCFEGTDGSATVTASGGNGELSYAWNDSQDTPTATNLIAGIYTVTITDELGCELVLEVTIGQPDELTSSTSATPESSLGANDGSATATGMGGTPPYTYAWSNTENTQTINNLPPGIYIVTITDDNGCSIVDEVEVLPGNVDCSTLSATIQGTDAICFGGDDGSATVTASGGNGELSYNWSNSQNTPTATNLIAGIYTVTITDELGCELILEVTIGEGPEITSSIDVTHETFLGANDGTATANPVGGVPPYTYAWNNSGNTQTITNLSPGVYIVTITDSNGCTMLDVTEVLAGNIDCSTLFGATSGTDVSCFGGDDGTATVNAGGGNGELSYTWSDSQNTATATATNLSVGTYSVTITDEEGCELVLEVTIGQPDELTGSTSVTPESSLGANDGSATATGMGGTPPYMYSWSNTGNTQTINNLPPDVYTVTITDDNGCTIVDEVEVLAGNIDCSTLSATISGTLVSCFGGNDGTATVVASGGNGELSYVWSNSQNTATATNLSAGIQSATITDELGCELIMEINIEQAEQLLVSASATPESSFGANDGTAFANANGGTPPYSYLWSTNEITQGIVNLMPGIYTVTITDDNGCTVVDEVEVLAGNIDCSSLSITVDVVDVNCFGDASGSITVNATGGNGNLSYVWSTSDNTNSISNLQAGTYIVTVSDELGCEIVQEIELFEPQAAITPNLSSIPESSLGANDGMATASPTGGVGPYTYLWNTSANTATINDLAPGIYTVVITDANGCTMEESIEVLAGAPDCSSFVAVPGFTDVSCFGGNDGTASVDVTGGEAPYDISWSNSASGTSINGLSAGTYGVTISDEVGCTTELTIQVNQPDELLVNVTGVDGSCGDNAFAEANVSGGTLPYSYLWNNSETTQIISDLTTGVYTVTITDGNGCTKEQSVEVVVTGGGIDVDADKADVSCFGEEDGFIDLTITSGTPPLTFQWSNGATTEDIFDLPAGNYTVFVEDADGCSFLSAFKVNSPADLNIGFDVSDPTPPSNSNGILVANAFGGTPPFTYQWSNGGNGPVNSGLSPGSYFLTITDANGCIATDSVDLNLSTSIFDLDNLNRFELYPNPTPGELTVSIEMMQATAVNLEVYNIVGQRIYFDQKEGQAIEWRINLTGVARGTYLVRIVTPDGQASRKFIVASP